MENSKLTVDKAIEILTRISANRGGESILGVRYEPGFVTVGSLPFVSAENLHAGFDWDKGKVFITLDKKLGIVGDDLESLKEKTNKTSEVMAWIQMTIKDKRLSSDEKLKIIEEEINSLKKKK